MGYGTPHHKIINHDHPLTIPSVARHVTDCATQPGMVISVENKIWTDFMLKDMSVSLSSSLHPFGIPYCSCHVVKTLCCRLHLYELKVLLTCPPVYFTK